MITPTPDYKSTACIVYPAKFIGSTEKSHCTAMFLGDTDQLPPRHLVQNAVDYLRDEFESGGTFVQVAQQFALFGRNYDVLVAKLESPRLMRLRAKLEPIMERLGVRYPRDWEYTPHVSLAQGVDNKLADVLVGINMNMIIRLDAPVLWWNDDRPSSTATQPALFSI